MSDQLVQAIADMRDADAIALARQILESDADPMSILDDCRAAMEIVGKRFEQGEYFLPELIMAGETLKQIAALVKPRIQQASGAPRGAKIVLGTVQGDIHDMGKNMLAMLLSCYGFTVIDLGVDVAPSEFAKKALELKPDIVGLSALLISAHETIRETVTLLHYESQRSGIQFAIIIGGGQINDQVRAATGADYYGEDAMAGVRLCQRLTTQAR